MANYYIKLWFTNLNNQLYGFTLKVELPQVRKFMWEIMIDNNVSVSFFSKINEAIGKCYVSLKSCHLSFKTGSPIGNSADQFSKTYWPAQLWFLCVSFLVLKLQVYTTLTSWMSDGKEFRLHVCSATTFLTENLPDLWQMWVT